MSRSSLLLQQQDIRQNVRGLRLALTLQQQEAAANQVTDQAINFPPVAEAQNLAVFLSIDGEINTRLLITKLWKQKKNIFLPTLHPFSPGHLLFLRYTSETQLIPNQFGIPEPPLDIRQLITLDKLDVIMVPLVAFDYQGQRLGMGGGFYDRTLLNWRKHAFLPIGLAHDCQFVDALPTAEWDVPLPAVLTPEKLWLWK